MKKLQTEQQKKQTKSLLFSAIKGENKWQHNHSFFFFLKKGIKKKGGKENRKSTAQNKILLKILRFQKEKNQRKTKNMNEHVCFVSMEFTLQ